MIDINFNLNIGSAIREWLRQREREKLRQNRLNLIRARAFARRYRLDKGALKQFLDEHEKNLTK